MKKEMKQFFDINKLPSEEGILFCAVSMNQISSTQSPDAFMGYINDIATKVGKTKGIGMNIVYSDYLYFLSEEPAATLRTKYKELMITHKYGLLHRLEKNNLWIQKAFSFQTLGQVYLDNGVVIHDSLRVILELYKKDKEFHDAVAFDAQHSSRGVGKNEINFLLEELTVKYLIQKRQLLLPNEYIEGKEKWVLQCYPGKPLKSEVYLFQKNPLELKDRSNKYENSYYDNLKKILYNYEDIDAETFNFIN